MSLSAELTKVLDDSTCGFLLDVTGRNNSVSSVDERRRHITCLHHIIPTTTTTTTTSGFGRRGEVWDGQDGNI